MINTFLKLNNIFFQIFKRASKRHGDLENLLKDSRCKKCILIINDAGNVMHISKLVFVACRKKFSRKISRKFASTRSSCSILVRKIALNVKSPEKLIIKNILFAFKLVQQKFKFSSEDSERETLNSASSNQLTLKIENYSDQSSIIKDEKSSKVKI